jgi:hypothetical protein
MARPSREHLTATTFSFVDFTGVPMSLRAPKHFIELVNSYCDGW